MIETARAQRRRDHWRWNTLCVTSFVTGSALAAVGMANNIRYSFWNNFVHGFGEIETPFADIKTKYAEKFKGTVSQYNADSISQQEYRTTMRNHATDYRQEVFTRLEKDFNIPSNGWRGWTEGTLKRWQELGVNGRIHNTVGIASIAATTIGAVILMARQQHNTNRIENKMEEQQLRQR